jgi:hypothetical protein
VSAARRAQLVLAVVSLVIGLGGLVVASGLEFTEARGEILLGLGVSFNPLGALVLAGLSIAALLGALLGNRSAVLLAVVGYGLAGLQVLVQFGRDTNWLGSRGSNLSFALALAIGLLSLEWSKRQEAPQNQPLAPSDLGRDMR